MPYVTGTFKSDWRVQAVGPEDQGSTRTGAPIVIAGTSSAGGTGTVAIVTVAKQDSDGRGTLSDGLCAQAYPMVFNGTTWDRLRAASAASGTTGTGVPASGTMVFDGTNFQRAAGDTSGRVQIVGPADQGATRTGAPIVIAGTGSVAGGGAVRIITSIDQGSDGKSTLIDGLCTSSFPLGYNETSWDRWRNNVDGTALASAARTADTTSADITNYNARGVIIYFDITAVTGTPSLTLNVEGKDPVSGGYRRIFVDTSARSTIGLFGYIIYPGAQNVVSYSAASGGAIPRTWRVKVQHGTADSVTYSVGYSLII